MTQPLLIITRPINRSQRLQSWALEHHWESMLLPLLDIQAVENLSGCLKNIHHYDALFFVSPTAADLALPYIQNYQGDCVATGWATAQIIQNIHANVLYPTHGNDSEAVLQLPLWQQKQGKILIIRGHGGRDFLASQLSSLGWSVDFAEIYQRIPSKIPLEIQEKIFMYDGKIAVAIFSYETARIWLENIASPFYTSASKLLYLTIHPRIGDLLRSAGMKFVTDYASEKDLLKGLSS
ncbi:MAG: uroporphyrinogen-III synthase [Neisseriaceae bacterium]|nr:uroporphyrinogen-III synthase [Neisseriaceae bacterium]